MFDRMLLFTSIGLVDSGVVLRQYVLPAAAMLPCYIVCACCCCCRQLPLQLVLQAWYGLAHPYCSSSELRAAISASCRDLGDPAGTPRCGYGLVQALAAHQFLLSQPCVNPAAPSATPTTQAPTTPSSVSSQGAAERSPAAVHCRWAVWQCSDPELALSAIGLVMGHCFWAEVSAAWLLAGQGKGVGILRPLHWVPLPGMWLHHANEQDTSLRFVSLLMSAGLQPCIMTCVYAGV